MTTPKQIQFFIDQAGYSYDPKTETPEQGRERCALALAEAETRAAQEGVTYDWSIDRDGCGCEDEGEHESYSVLALDANGHVFASLGAVCGLTREYRRVVEAELACELSR